MLSRYISIVTALIGFMNYELNEAWEKRARATCHVPTNSSRGMGSCSGVQQQLIHAGAQLQLQ